MNAGSLKQTGLSGLIWGVLAIAVFLVGILFVARAVSSGAAPSAAGGSAMIIKIFSLVAALALIWVLFNLSKLLDGIGTMACYGTMLVTLILAIVGLLNIQSGILALILLVLQGVGLILVGVFSLMSKKINNGAFKAFSILLIIAGASLALVILAFLYPFVALAAGICLFVSMNAAAKSA
jgi:hypothetical protein